VTIGPPARATLGLSAALLLSAACGDRERPPFLTDHGNSGPIGVVGESAPSGGTGGQPAGGGAPAAGGAPDAGLAGGAGFLGIGGFGGGAGEAIGGFGGLAGFGVFDFDR
jgi:hypothetical protein